MKYNIPVNSIEQVFQAIFLNKEGRNAESQGIPTDGNDHFFFVSPIVLNISRIESYYETPHLHNGKKVLNVRTHSGDEWSLLSSIADMLMMKKTSDFFSN